MALTLAFYKGRREENRKARVFDRLVTWWPRSRGRFSHVELVTTRLWGSAHCWSSSARDGGVREKWIDLATGRWVLVVLPDHDVTPAVAWFDKHVGQPYDYPGILGYVLPLKQQRRWWYCSEAVAAALTLSAKVGDPDGKVLPAPPSTDIPPSALFAWCQQQPGVQTFELPALEAAHG